ncbi:MAG: DUF1289 domain-containing protein [Candidatus Woesearchaeota archaeon]
MKKLINKTPTNCVGRCKLIPILNYCNGCRRTLEQIKNWSKYTSEQREAILSSKLTNNIPEDRSEPRFFTKTRIINQHG